MSPESAAAAPPVPFKRQHGRRKLCRKLTLFCVLAVAILTVSLLVFSGAKTRQLEQEHKEEKRRRRSGDRGRDRKKLKAGVAAHASLGGSKKVNVTTDNYGGATTTSTEATDNTKFRLPQVTIPTGEVIPLDTFQETKADKKLRFATIPGTDVEKNEKLKGETKEDRKPPPSKLSPVPKLSKAEARLAQIESMKMNFPPLETLLRNKTSGRDEYNIIGDVSFLLDFAILGHAKTATSFMTKWFADHPNMAIWEEEVCTLYNYQPAVLARKLYNDFPQSNVTTHRGFKCPGHFSYQYLRYFRRYFTNTRIIVGVRHPVRWFESFYNFLVRKGHELPHPSELLGSCANHEHKGFCTDRAQFHQNLAKFGKTNLRDPTEMALLRLPAKSLDYLKTDNPIFLYEMSQIYDSNQTRLDRFKSDLQKFLRLPTPLPDSTDAADKTTTTRGKKKVLNICLEEYDAVRAELTDIGSRASIWIRKFFMRLDPSQVTISNRDFFERALKEWMYDPCIGAANASSTGSGLSQVFKPKSVKAKSKASG